MSWQARVMTVFEQATLKRRPERDSLERIRTRFGANARRVPSVPQGWAREAVDEGALRGEWLRPANTTASESDAPTILFLHGGGYIFCSVATHRVLADAVAIAAGMRTFSLEYRLAPEHPFPAAVDDAVAAYRALLESGTPAKRIALVGDSAGGGLALATAISARDQGLALPAALLLFSPLTDLAATGDSIRENTRRDAMFHGHSIGQAAGYYLNGTSATDPLASPLYADLAGLPPICIHASDSEILRDDSVRVAARAREAGVDVHLRLFHAVPHDWQFLANFVPEARESLAEGSSFLQARLSRDLSPAE